MQNVEQQIQCSLINTISQEGKTELQFESIDSEYSLQ